MKVIDVQQGTPEWLAARSGMPTASRIVDVLATVKSGEAASRRDYKAQIVAEKLTNRPQGSTYLNDDMRFGIENEPLARAEYEIRNNVMVDQVGFVLHPKNLGGSSPDGLVGKDGLVEIKCPKVSTHLNYIIDGIAPPKYQLQMLWQMACTGRQWCDFVSFRPDLPPHLQLFVVRFPRDEKRIQEIEEGIKVFLSEVDELLAKLPKPKGRKAKHGNQKV